LSMRSILPIASCSSRTLRTRVSEMFANAKGIIRDGDGWKTDAIREAEEAGEDMTIVVVL